MAAHFTVVAIAGLIGALAATTQLVDEPCDHDGPALARPSGRLAGLAAIAFCAFLIDGSAIQWSAVHVRGSGAGEALAAAAFATFAAAVTFCRLAGDRVIERAGRPRAVRGAALLAAAGVALAMVAPGPVVALAGWALLGAGVAVVAPAVSGAAPRGEPAARARGDRRRDHGRLPGLLHRPARDRPRSPASRPRSCSRWPPAPRSPCWLPLACGEDERST